MDRLNTTNNFEGGLSTTVGFDYEIEGDNNQKKFGLTMGQVINEKENKNMPSTSSLDEKLSDVVGNMSFNPSKKVSLNYNFAIDQNYNDLNFNEISTDLNLTLKI